MITLSFWSIIRLHPLYVFSTYFSEKKKKKQTVPLFNYLVVVNIMKLV